MTASLPDSQCPSCGEPTKTTWRICPVCETQLKAPECPQCGAAVKANWKRCPECEAALFCPQCQRRLPKGHQTCPGCLPGSTPPVVSAEAPESELTEPACGIELVYVPGGTFDMGDTFGEGSENELPVHRVGLDGFYMGRYAVTQSQWQRLMTDNPSKAIDPQRPVEQITWDDALAFIDRLNQEQQEGYRFDLPTEAQWEFAARSGGHQERYAGHDDINAVAWYETNSQGHSHPVGKKAPNGLGLYDMSGNVWEWCRDAFDADAYNHHPTRNPSTDLPVEDRVIRGGSWHLDAWSARCARRFSCARDFLGPALGFRVVMCKV